MEAPCLSRSQNQSDSTERALDIRQAAVLIIIHVTLDGLTSLSPLVSHVESGGPHCCHTELWRLSDSLVLGTVPGMEEIPNGRHYSCSGNIYNLFLFYEKAEFPDSSKLSLALQLFTCAKALLLVGPKAFSILTSALWPAAVLHPQMRKLKLNELVNGKDTSKLGAFNSNNCLFIRINDVRIYEIN